jgi:hypothetical protein
MLEKPEMVLAATRGTNRAQTRKSAERGLGCLSARYFAHPLVGLVTSLNHVSARDWTKQGSSGNIIPDAVTLSLIVQIRTNHLFGRLLGREVSIRSRERDDRNAPVAAV